MPHEKLSLVNCCRCTFSLFFREQQVRLNNDYSRHICRHYSARARPEKRCRELIKVGTNSSKRHAPSRSNTQQQCICARKKQARYNGLSVSTQLTRHLGALVCIIVSAYYNLVSTAFSLKSYYFQPKGLSTKHYGGQERGGSRANGEGIHGLEGLGWEGWREVVVLGGQAWRKTQNRKHMNSLPNGPEPHFP